MEFCSHIARHFTLTDGKDKIERARLALADMGSSVSWISECDGFSSDEIKVELTDPLSRFLAALR